MVYLLLQSTKAYDNKVDIYALGIVWVELWCPFGSFMEQDKAVKNLRAREPVFPNKFSEQVVFICVTFV